MGEYVVMGAKINNMPVYVVYDRSNGYSYTTYTDHETLSFGGTQNLATDKNLTTSWDIIGTYDFTGAGVVQIGIVFDYGQVLWNTQVYVKWGSTQAGTLTIDTSDDGVTWTNQITGVGTKTFNAMSFRYIRFDNTRAANADVNILLYEVRVMGS